MALLEASSMNLIEWRGAIVLISPQLKHVRDTIAPHIRPCADPLHITLLTKAEYAALGRPAIPEVNLSHIYILGISSNKGSDVQWLVTIWNHGNAYRQRMKIPSKDFHVTLSDRDDYGVDKGVMSIKGGGDSLLHTCGTLTEDAFDHLLASKATPVHPQLASHMVHHHPKSYKSFIRLGDSSVSISPKVAALSYARALALNSGVFDYVLKKLLRLSHQATWGPVVTQKEFETIQAERLDEHLLRPWSGVITTLCNGHLWRRPTESRDRMLYIGRKLPRFFAWLYPHRLAAMSTPRNEADIDLLMDMGVTTIVTLTAEEPLNPAWFAFKPITHIFIPVKNYDSPTIAEMDIIYDRFRQDTHGRWLVHCGGGKGRAGTVIGCLIAMYGYDDTDYDTATPKMDGSTIIRELRDIRPGSIESERQERFIGEWLSHRWAIAQEDQIPSESPTSLDITLDHGAFPQGLDHLNAQVCFLVGVPGSGKSWLANAIAKRRAAPTVIISQDESRSRQNCENALGAPYSDDTLIILDRCNPDIKGRKEWLSLTRSARRSVAIYFDYDVDQCLKRVDNRLGHPTIKPGRGKNAMQQMLKSLTRPALREGFGAVLSVSSFAAACEAVYLLGGPTTIIKFPRTPHLIDLGATSSDDIVLGAQHMTGNLVVEEKVDGANMGFSLDWNRQVVVQNRSHYVCSTDHAQFKLLSTWVDRHLETLCRILGRDEQYPERYILYGEWVAAGHSIRYSHLPDTFLAFDLYDRHHKSFISRKLLSSALRGTGIEQVPLVCETSSVSVKELTDMVQQQSRFYNGRVEGVYIRTENKEKTRTIGRGKVVRSDFLAGNEHWSKGPLVLNGIVNDNISG